MRTSGLIRPWKFRLPDSTDTTVRSLAAHRVLHLGDQRSGGADAGHAAVTGEVEAELLQVGGEAGGVEIVGDHAGAG